MPPIAHSSTCGSDERRKAATSSHSGSVSVPSTERTGCWMVATRSASKAHTVSEGNSMPKKVSASAIRLRDRAGNTLLEQCAHVVQSRPLTPLRNMANEAPWSPLV